MCDATGWFVMAVPPHRVADVLGRAIGAEGKHIAANEQPGVVGGRIDVDELTRVGVAREELAIVEAELDQLAAEREQERAVGAGPDRHPLVGDGRVAGADRIDRHEAAAVALELRDRDLERIRMMVLGGADHHEQLRAVEVGAAEFPERAAEGVDHPGRHVDRAEAAVRGVVRRAELAREEARQRLHLVAAGEEREALRVGGADPREPRFERRERLVP